MIKVIHIETGKTYMLTREQFNRFFDNRNPYDWKVEGDE